MSGRPSDERIATLRRWCQWLDRAWDCDVAPRTPHALARDVLGPAGLSGHVEALERVAAARTRLATNLALVGEVARAGVALDREGVRWVAIKGAAMVIAHPRLMAARAMADVDLVVAHEQLDAAHRSLAAIGYSAIAPPTDKGVTLRDRDGNLLDVHARLGAGAAEPLVLAHPERVRGVNVAGPVGRLVASSVHRARGSFSGDLREVFDLWLELRAVSALGHDAVGDAAAALVDHEVGAIVLLAGVEARAWFDSRCEEPMLLAELRRQVAPVGLFAVSALEAVRQAGGRLPWAGVPIAGRALSLALLSPDPSRVVREAAQQAAVRVADVIRHGPAAGGRAGLWAEELGRAGRRLAALRPAGLPSAGRRSAR